MEKKIFKFLFSIILITIFSIIGSISMNLHKVWASEASISANNCTVGENFNVTVNIPQDAIGYNGVVTVTYSDGSSSSKNIYGLGQDMNDINADYYWPGNASVSFSAKVAGNATIAVSNLNLTNKSGGKINSQSTVTTAISIAGTSTSPATTPAPSTGSTPNATSTPNTSSNPSTKPKPATPKNITFKDTNEKMYTTQRVNIRQGYGTSSIVIQTLPQGVEVTRTGIGSENVDGYAWSRVSYNGITGYVISSALTSTSPTPEEPSDTQDPQTPEEDPAAQEPEENPDEENLEEMSPDDIRNQEIQKIAEELGAIPAVGKEEVIKYFEIIVGIIIFYVVIFKIQICSLKRRMKPLSMEEGEFLTRKIDGKFENLSSKELKIKKKYYDTITKIRIKREKEDRKKIRAIRKQDLIERKEMERTKK